MVTTGAIIYGKCHHQLEFNNEEHPVAIQLGGSDIKDLVECSKISEGYGYDEINLNVGCPSDRVQKGRFGACLMLESDHVMKCLESMQNAVDIPVSIKCRLGVDKEDSYEFLYNFIKTVEKHSGYKVACLEEIAFKMRFINLKKLKELTKPFGDSSYGKYLKLLINENQ